VPDKGTLSELFQISEIKIPSPKRSKSLNKRKNPITLNLELHVRVLDRADEHLRCKTKDNRKVVMTGQKITIPVTKLDGKCQVRHFDHIDDLDKYKEDPDNFWVKDKIIFADSSKSLILGTQALDPIRMRYSQETECERAKFRAAKKEFLSKGYRLLGVDLFGGVGGLALGLHRSGSVETKHMVEFAPSSAKTAEQNMPSLDAHNEDISSFLKRAFEGQARISNSLLLVDMSERPVRGIPIPGEIYFISAGFPCPGYSRANSNPQANDIKNTLIIPTLSLIELYRPAYVLLENVTGLLSHKASSEPWFDRILI
jgi:DNA (cytosine-5)-methyltransferase 1